MKRKHLTLWALAVLLVFAAGCGKNAGEPPKGTSAGNGSQSASNTNNSNSSSSSSSSSSSASQSNTSSTAKSTAPEKKTYEKVTLGPLKPGEAAKIGPVTVTLKQFVVVDKAAGLPAGYVHFVAELSISNEDPVAYTINVTDHLKFETPEGKKAPFNLQATANKSPRLQGTVEQGKNITGWAGYLVKKIGGNYKFMFLHPDYGQATWEFGI